jgi:CHAT domain-containing protein
VCQSKAPGRVGRGADKATAFGQAMAEVRAHERWSHPYYWGAFVLMGD